MKMARTKNGYKKKTRASTYVNEPKQAIIRTALQECHRQQLGRHPLPVVVHATSHTLGRHST